MSIPFTCSPDPSFEGHAVAARPGGAAAKVAEGPGSGPALTHLRRGASPPTRSRGAHCEYQVVTEPSAPRADTQRNRRELLAAAAAMLRDGERLTASAVAARAGLARATVYRHFATIGELGAAAAPLVAAASPGVAAPLGLFDVPTMLEHVTPHQVVEAIVAEARRQTGAATIALYLVDIDGTRLLRTTGDEQLPEELLVPSAVGPEIPIEQLERLHDAIVETLPTATVAPMVIRDRAVGALVGLDIADPSALQALARHAAVAVVVNDRFTDVVRRARRRRATTPSAETQQLLLPPRVARLTGLRLAGHVQPGYENGGNWFDHVENEDGAWIAAIDTLGSGERAAAISAVALGALRAERHAGSTPSAALLTMHTAVRAIGLRDVRCDAWVARWHSPSSHLFWASAGDLIPRTFRSPQVLTPLSTDAAPPLGSDDFPAPPINHRRLIPGEVVLLLSDGVTGGPAGALDRAQLDAAIQAAESLEPAALVAAILQHVTSADAIEDDAMVVALAPVSPLG
jgi:serine phosphatase RsbU (regulator of sigma subunit)